MVDDPAPKAPISEEQRAKISEGMRKAHARRRQANAGQKKAPASGGLLGQLIRERDALNIVIEGLQKRGVT